MKTSKKQRKEKSMRIVCVKGSPRLNGNSATIADYFLKIAERMGGKIRTFALNRLKYKGCQACMACKTKQDKCAMNDQLTEVLDAIRKADILVLATPIYFSEVTGQVKTFIDRTFSYLVPDYMTNPKPSRLTPGKKLVFIITYENSDGKSYADVFPRYELFFKFFGFSETHLIKANNVGAIGDIDSRDDILKLAKETAEKVMK
jgi:multimeric flavodoxin WrbA